MPEIESADNLYMILAFIVPGLIIVFVRAQFLTGRSPPHSEALLSYFTMSIIYWALMLPIINVAPEIENDYLGKIFAWAALVFFCPALLGVLLGFNAQKGLIRKLVRKSGMNPVDVMPTSWDWKFSSAEPQHILITLKNGVRFAGYCGPRSFISSDPGERDIYIEKVYDLDGNDNWIDRGDKSALIVAGEISTIEFWPPQQGMRS